MNALVLGSADCLYDDIADVERLTGGRWDGLVVAANQAGVLWPHRLDHWVTFHPQNMARWIGERADMGRNVDMTTWAHYGVQTDRTLDHWEGSSGMFAARVALHLGCERIILCGIPLDSRPHAVEHETWGSGDWKEANVYQKQLRESAHRYEGRVRSMSGFTAALFGSPTREWLALREVA